VTIRRKDGLDTAFHLIGEKASVGVVMYMQNFAAIHIPEPWSANAACRLNRASAVMHY
jgi:hypothetical protein